MTIYDINKQIMLKETPLTEDEVNEKKALIANYAAESGYYMLLCNDMKYYTMFDKNFEDGSGYFKIEDEVIECLYSLGEIYSIEPDKDNGTIEIWLKQEDEMYAMYFFDYTGGVIQCG